jgi:hypothetical protein
MTAGLSCFAQVFRKVFGPGAASSRIEPFPPRGDTFDNGVEMRCVAEDHALRRGIAARHNILHPAFRHNRKVGACALSGSSPGGRRTWRVRDAVRPGRRTFDCALSGPRFKQTVDVVIVPRNVVTVAVRKMLRDEPVPQDLQDHDLPRRSARRRRS